MIDCLWRRTNTSDAGRRLSATVFFWCSISSNLTHVRFPICSLSLSLSLSLPHSFYANYTFLSQQYSGIVISSSLWSSANCCFSLTPVTRWKIEEHSAVLTEKYYFLQTELMVKLKGCFGRSFWAWKRNWNIMKFKLKYKVNNFIVDEK